MRHEESTANRNALVLLACATLFLGLQLAVPKGAVASAASGVAAVTVSPSALAFGNQSPGGPTPSQIVTLTNGGTVAVSITEVAVTGGEAEWR